MTFTKIEYTIRTNLRAFIFFRVVDLREGCKKSFHQNSRADLFQPDLVMQRRDFNIHKPFF
jgi:hypothetical protein